MQNHQCTSREKGKRVVRKGMAGKRSLGYTFDSSVPQQILLFCQSVSSFPLCVCVCCCDQSVQYLCLCVPLHA